MRYENCARERDNLNPGIGMVLNGLEMGALRDHLLLNCSKYTAWVQLKEGVVSYKRATAPVDLRVTMLGSVGVPVGPTQTWTVESLSAAEIPHTTASGSS